MKSVLFRILIATLFLPHLSSANENDKLTVTYIATEGFLLESGGKKVLLDALFGAGGLDFTDTPSADTLNKITTAQPPFDNANLLLVTHEHVDHFDAGLVADYLNTHTQSTLIGPQQVVSKVLETGLPDQVKVRIHALTPSFGQRESISVHGIDITALRLAHLAYFHTDAETGEIQNVHASMQNLGYLIKLGNFTILHTGDSSLANGEEFKLFNLPQENIDIAFLGAFQEPYKPGIETVNEHIQPQHIVLMHLDKGDKEKYNAFIDSYPETQAPITFFRNELEQMEFSK